MSELSDDQWKAVRAVLKAGLLDGVIPVDGTDMRPKQVWTQYRDANVEEILCVDYEDKGIRDKFGRMLRSLRKKHRDGDLENENKGVIKWGKSAAKQFLKRCFREKTIPVDYENPEAVWNDHCKANVAFKRMQYDAAFVRRLGAVRDDHLKKVERCKADLHAYEIAIRNHPTPKLNSRNGMDLEPKNC